MTIPPRPGPEAGAEAFARWLERYGHLEDPRPNGEWRQDQIVFPTVKASSWAGKERPPRIFLDQRKMIPIPYVTMLAGQGAIGKTLLLLQLALACSTSTQWLGGWVKGGPAIVYSAEEPLRELHTRVDEICEAEHLHLNQLDGLEIADLSRVPDASLTRYDPKTGLWLLTDRYWALDALAEKMKPVLIGIDNRSMIVTGNENDRVGANFTVRNLGMIGERHGCAVMLLSHPSMTGISQGSGTSGSTGWQTAPRSFLYFRRPKEDGGGTDSYRGDDPGVPEIGDHSADDGARELINNKANYTRMDTKVNVKWEFYRFVCTDPPLDQPREEIGKDSKAERKFMELLHWHTKQGMEVSASPGSPSYGPKLFDRHQGRDGINMRWFERAYRSLLDKGRVRIVMTGKGVRQKQCIVPAENFNPE